MCACMYACLCACVLVYNIMHVRVHTYIKSNVVYITKHLSVGIPGSPCFSIIFDKIVQFFYIIMVNLYRTSQRTSKHNVNTINLTLNIAWYVSK